jgi:Ca2+:H+ antiporter
MSGPRPPPSSTSGPGPQASTGSSQQRTPSRTPSSPNRPRTDLLQPPSSPAAHTSTASGMSSNTPVRSSDLTRSQTSSTTNSPYATARSQHQSPYQPSIHSSSASFVSSTSGEEEDPSPSGHGARDARSASTSAAAPPPTSYAQAAARARQPSLTRLSSYAGGGQTTRQRSSSRARPANKRQQTSTGVSAAEDDEVRVLDRGEELIRRRNKERRAHAAALGRGQSYIDAVEGGRPGGLPKPPSALLPSCRYSTTVARPRV